MPRPLRPVADGLVYHVINRGNNRQQVFFGEGDYAAFLKAIGDLKRRKPFEVYGYCLMANHFHLLLRPLEGSISRIMQSLLVSHTQRYHRFHQSGGHVWQGRFKSPVVQDDDHLLAVLRYIEVNPVRTGIVDEPRSYRWSSFAAHAEGTPDDLLDRVEPYEQLGPNRAVRRRRWSAYVRQVPEDAELAAIRRSTETGLPFGDKHWAQQLSKQLGLDLIIRKRGRPKGRKGVRTI